MNPPSILRFYLYDHRGRLVIPSLRPTATPTHAFRWVWAQEWLDVLFLHWRVPLERLRPHVPRELDIETFEGAAWVCVVIFRLKVRPRGLPYVPFVSDLVEVNLRTYVRCRGTPGIIFLTVHADNRLAMAAGKLFTPMPYQRAKLAYRRGEFDSSLMQAKFETCGKESEAERGSLDEFLLERYRLYAIGRRSELLHADVMHPPWRTQAVEAQIESNRFGEELGLGLSTMPERMHFSAGVSAKFGRFNTTGSAVS